VPEAFSKPFTRQTIHRTLPSLPLKGREPLLSITSPLPGEGRRGSGYSNQLHNLPASACESYFFTLAFKL